MGAVGAEIPGTMSNALDRARAYLAQLPPAISGQGGHNATFRAACWVVRFGLGDGDAMILLREFNQRCQPPWTEKELAHKLRDARKVVRPTLTPLGSATPAVRETWSLERYRGRGTAFRPATTATTALSSASPDTQPVACASGPGPATNHHQPNLL